MKYLLIIAVLFSACSSKKEPAKVAALVATDPVMKVSYNAEDSLKDATVKKYNVSLVEGKHKFGGTTKIEYLNTLQVMDNAKDIAKKRMWTDEKLNGLLSFIRTENYGGKIKLNIERNTIEGANTNMFSVVIKDTSGTEIFRKKFPAEVAEVPSDTKYWWNMGEVDIDKKIRPPFDIFLIDNLQDAPFRFAIR